jgi:hypothetical protein
VRESNRSLRLNFLGLPGLFQRPHGASRRGHWISGGGLEKACDHDANPMTIGFLLCVLDGCLQRLSRPRPHLPLAARPDPRVGPVLTCRSSRSAGPRALRIVRLHPRATATVRSWSLPVGDDEDTSRTYRRIRQGAA